MLENVKKKILGVSLYLDQHQNWMGSIMSQDQSI